MNDWLASFVLGPIAVGLFFLLLREWREVRTLKHDKETIIAKVSELEKHNAEVVGRLKETREQKDAEIDRQKKEIVELHQKLLSEYEPDPEWPGVRKHTKSGERVCGICPSPLFIHTSGNSLACNKCSREIVKRPDWYK